MLWLAAALVYSAVRITLVHTFLGPYGLNIWLYAAVDLGSTVPYAIGSARAVGALVDGERGRAVRWGLLTATSYVLPDLTIVLTTRRVPLSTYLVLAVVLSTAGSLAVTRIRREVRSSRAEREAAAA